MSRNMKLDEFFAGPEVPNERDRGGWQWSYLL